MRELGTTEFAKRIANNLRHDPDFMVTWFLGAGCSISSGIPPASALTRHWLERMHATVTDGAVDLATWAAGRFPGIDLGNPSTHYGDVMEALFLTVHDQQVEVERIISGKDPSIGYALLALMAASEDFGARTNTFLTTNFDDLIADALYLTTNKKPLVIASELLATYARRSRRRPLVMKVHGDALLGARNTGKQTRELPPEIGRSFRSLLSNTALVFCGYSGSDVGVARIFAESAPEAFVHGLFWVGGELPTGPLGERIVDRDDLFHVALDDFDLLLLEVAHNLQLELPDGKRFTAVFDQWKRSVARHGSAARADTAGQAAARDDFSSRLDALSLVRQAHALGAGNIPGADDLYRRAVDASPTDSRILGSYAVFLKNQRKDYDQAQAFYLRAIDADPTNASNLGNYAIFLSEQRKDYDQAETFYLRAIDADPTNASNLGNYASFLKSQRKDYDQAETFYLRAIDADPTNANNLGNYASFLSEQRKDYDQAETFYLRAIDADPTNANNLSNYANFLSDQRKDYDQAETFYLRAIGADPTNANNLGNYAHCLFLCHHDSHAAKGSEITKALTSRADMQDALALEVQFYRACHDRNDASGSKVRRMLEAGTRSPGWNFVAHATRQGELEPDRAEFLHALAKVASDEAPIEALDGYNEWRAWETSAQT